MPISWPHFKLSAPISKTILKLQFLTSRSKLFSLLASSIPPQLTSPVPTHQHITHLILDQKSPSEALRTFKWASKLSNFTHDQSTYRALIHKLCTFRHFDDARKLLEEMPRSIGSPPDENVLITFTRGLGRAHRIKEVIMVPDLILKFDVMPTLKLYNSILDVLVKEDIDIARGFYRKKMMECGVKGDDYTFGILMKGLCLTNRIGDGFKLLQVMKSRGGKQNTVVYNTLLHALCKNGKVGRARSLMNEMIEPNGVTYNLLISAYCKEENLVQAMVMLEKSFDAGFVPDVVTVTKVIELLCNVGRVVEAVEIVERTEASGGKIDVIAYNTLINGFCNIGKARVAVRYLKEMELKGRLPNADTYNALISGFCETGMVDAALELFNEMKRDGINWNFVTFDTLIAGLCSKGLVDEGFKILELMEDSKGGSGGHISPYNNIIYALYIKNRWEEAFTFLTKMNRMFPRATYRSLMIIGSCEEGSVDTAKKVYQQMIEEGGMPSVLVYSSLIRALCLQNCFKEAFDLMNKMINCKFFPSVSTYNYVVSSFCSQGKVTNSLKLLNDMVGRGCLPDSGTYSPIIDAFCQRGELGKATEVFHQMVDKGIAPTANIWTSLLDHLSGEKLWLKSETSSGIHSQIQWIVQP